MNTPNKITVARICLIPVFVAIFFIPFSYNRLVAAFVYAIACFTDFLDGYLARKNNQITTLGKFLDPIADKLLVACALIAICLDSITPQILQVLTAIFTMIILCREIMVSCFRIIASTKNVVLAADKWGKVKTVLQMISLIILIPYGTVTKQFSQNGGKILYYVGFGILAAATIMTIFSGLNYVLKNKKVFKD